MMGKQKSAMRKIRVGVRRDSRPPLNCMIRPSWIAPLNVVRPQLSGSLILSDGKAAHCWQRRRTRARKVPRLQGINDAEMIQAWIAQLYGEQMQRNARFSMCHAACEARANGRLTTNPLRTTHRYPPPDVLPPDTADGKPPIPGPARSTAWVESARARGCTIQSPHDPAAEQPGTHGL